MLPRFVIKLGSTRPLSPVAVFF
ncbi:protein of unknown function [Cyanobium sp. NIES-981]|nr:protein of unknown function [Cyanobium sp. NIES-981]SBO44781.1 protein of unknown function [Cyanobium sp. NIES-981]SBO44991.1 protein of unknown function [Cyanobium sp. NIES-981]